MKIIWSNKAKVSYLEIIDFLLSQWSVDIAEEFESKTNQLLNTLLLHKMLCPKSKKENLRRCVIHHNTSLIYRISSTNIELITFIDNRTKHHY